MREIKFRLPWFKLSDNTFSHFTYWGRINHKGELSEDCFTSPSTSSHHYHKEDQQYTGLKDKNGKEIYEGDWCEAKFRDREGIQVIQGQIIMDEYMWCIDCQGCVGDDIFSINRPHNFEIIGNIYENPELLKQE